VGLLKDQSDYVMGKHRMNVVCSACNSKGLAPLPELKVVDSSPNSRFTYTNTRLIPQDIVKPLISVFDQIGYK
jgi:hypothetical protein